jgi:arginyl-tRNA synthetase
MTLKQEIRKNIQASLQKQALNFTQDIKVLEPEENKFGDYSTNIAFLLTKEIKKNPQEIAQQLQQELIQRGDIFKDVQIAGNGFINFFLREDFLYRKLQEVIEKKEAFFQLTSQEKLNIQVEFISANPTGALHLGHGRNGFYGDVLARILKKAGHNVEREFYVNDAQTSAQIQELGKTVLGKGNQYKSDYLAKIVARYKNEINKFQDFSKAGHFIAHKIIEEMKELTDELGIKFDRWFSEEILYKNKAQEKLLATLKEKSLIYSKEGALWLKTSKFGDDKDRVIVRSSGASTYFLADILYHQDKIARGFDKIIDVWGADHQGHCKKMQALMKILDFKGTLEIPIIQMVHLKTAQGPRKMSKRAGTTVDLKELVEKVGKDVVRFMLVSKDISTQMVFDLKLAQEKSDQNPVYYLQYALVRCKSIFKNVKEQKMESSFINFLKEKEELALIKEILKLPDLFLEISQNYEVHHLANYGINLAKHLHKFYKKHHVLSNDKELSQARLSLIKATVLTLETLFDTLGITKLQKM